MQAVIGCLIGLVFVVGALAEPLLEGRVRLASGDAVAAAQVQIFDMTDLQRGAVAQATTDERGYFSLPLAGLPGLALPARFELGANYPNPFNPSTLIPYQLAASSHVRLEVFNLLGQRIATLVAGERSAGVYTALWDATDGSGQAVGAGVYLYRLTVGGDSQTGRMVLVDGQAGVAAVGGNGEWPVEVAPDRSYGLVVSGEGIAPYVVADLGIQAGMGPVELVVEAHPAGKALGDDDSPFDLSDLFNTPAEEEDDDALVSIPDANLRAAIETALGKTSGAPITVAEMATLTRLDVRNKGIRSLTGLEFATNLTWLDLGGEGVGGKWLNSNEIADLSPLSGLTGLTYLDLYGNSFSDISVLSSLTNLTGLGLGGNGLSDISILSSLTNLTLLYLDGNNLSDLSPLVANTGLGSGDEVELRGNPLSCTALNTHIPALQSRGVTVHFDGSGDGSDDCDTLDIEGSFTGSTGRTILYRYWIKKDWDTTQPRGLLISFHGNNQATAEDILWWRFEFGEALDLGLAVARVASPSSFLQGAEEEDLFGYDIDSHGTRLWTKQDQRLIHELLQNGFNSTLAIDHDRIIFMGASQGTCFLAKFLERYAGIYGGGFHAWCGCFWGGPSPLPPRASIPWTPSFQWTPFTSSFVKSRFRVFVEATTEDFLHKDAVAMKEYYSEMLGLETRWDLETPGGHCDSGATSAVDIWKWLSSISVPDRPEDETDIDGDGIANAVDLDDDNDGALDFIDALPLEPRDWLDTDGDGIGNFADADADGDGVDNALDPFPLNVREWLDTDSDGIGDNLDADDDNDGIPDGIDSSPLSGTRKDQLAFRLVETGVDYVYASYPSRHPAAFVHKAKPASVVYPKSQGDRQSYQYINLGNSVNPRFEIMIDRFYRKESCEATLLPSLCNPETPNFAYFEHYIDKIYIDRNHNQNLTDDGPPLILARNNGDIFPFPSTITVLEVPYASDDSVSDVFPYGIILWTYADLSKGAYYNGASTWMGYVEAPSGERVLVGVVDANLDGLFNSGDSPDDFGNDRVQDLQDIACIDLDRNGVLNECAKTEDDTGERVNPVYPGEPFELDGTQYTISVAPSGHSITWSKGAGKR